MIFFTGFLIGVVSLIPGISGGTILVIMKKYQEVANAITNFKKKENIILLGKLILGIILGTITFARIIELMFYFIPTSTIILFSGFIIFQLPSLIKEEKIKPSFFWTLLGAIFIFFLSSFHVDTPSVIINYPQINLLFLISFAFCGAIDGFFTIIPGVSGSMIMMILGPYFLYKSFLANLNLQNWHFLFPLLFYFIGDGFGFYLGSKLSLFFLKKRHQQFMNFILGMIIASIIVLLPTPEFKCKSMITFAIPLCISYIFCSLLKLMNRSS